MPIVVPAGITFEPDRGSWHNKPWLPPIKTEMQGGNVRARRRPGDYVEIDTFTVTRTGAETTTIVNFLKNDCFNGTARFQVMRWNKTAFELRTVQLEGDVPEPDAIAFDSYRTTISWRVF